jgi:hypothetical protein
VSVAAPAIAVPGPEPGSQNFTIIFNHLDERIRIDTIDFHTATGWDFGDRGAYRCAWVEHFTSGALDFIVAFDRVGDAEYMQVNDSRGKESSNDCASSDNGESTFDGSDHFPHGTTLTFDRQGAPFESISLNRGCSAAYYTPGDEPGEAWLWWDPDGPQETEHGLGNCDGGPGEPVAVVRIHMVRVADGVGVCTADRIDGDVCGAPGPTPPPTHASEVTMTLRGTIRASGFVHVHDGTAACVRDRAVLLERRSSSGGWKTVGRDRTSDTGRYSDHIRGRDGVYRARVLSATLGTGDTCRPATSRRRLFQS